MISNRILLKVSTKLNEDILERACADRVGITAVFDSWTNIKQEHLFGVVLITSQSISLIWNTCNISNQWLKTENIKILIKSIMDNAEKESIRINCYISDSAGEYVVARRQLRIEYPNKDDNKDFAQELKKLTVSDSETCLLTTNNLPSKVTEATEVTKVIETTEATEMIEEDIVDKAETSDEEENWSNVIKNWVGILDSENRLENSEIVNDELPEFEF
ncbi:35998_t:CDS:2, partial [Racocetra persica]